MCDDCVRQDHLSITSPYSRNPRVLCVTGVLPDDSNDCGKIDGLVFKLIQLDRDKPGEPIVLVINGPGGSMDAFLRIRNTVTFLSSPVYTVTNHAFSAAALLFINGKRGHRYIFEGGHVLLHLSRLSILPPGKGWRQFWKKDSHEFGPLLQEDNELIAKMILDCSDAKELLARLGDWRGENDPQELTRGILTLLEKDQIFNAKEAVRCGLADKIIGQAEFDDLFR